MALTRMLQRRGTFVQWEAVKEDLILQDGEIGLETDTGKFKIGKLNKKWSQLDYVLDDSFNELKYSQLSGGNSISGAQNFAGNIIITGDLGVVGDVSIDGTLSLNDNKITDVLTPTNPTDAANKFYVDEVVAGLAWKEAAHLFANSHVATTGATGTLVIDGHPALVTADSGLYRIVLNAQTDSTKNGIYLYTETGGSYTLVRTTDAETADQLHGASIYIQEGTTYGTSSWVQSNYTADTFDELVWVQFSGAALINDGAGLLKDGNTLSVIGTDNRITVTPDNVDIASNYVGQTSIDTLGTVSTGTWQATDVGIAYGGTGASSAADARSNLEITPANIGAALASHDHNDVYYTETESDAKYSKLSLANTFTSTQNINSSDVNAVPVTIKAASGQLAAITSWTNSSNSQIASVDPSGIMTARNFATTTAYSTTSGTYAIDFASTNGTIIITATGDLTFTATNYSLYAGMPITVFIKPGGLTRTLTFPSGWAFLGSKPTSVSSNKIGVLTIVSTGSTESDCVASWVSQI